MQGRRFGYRGIGFVGWTSDQTSTGVVSPPTVAATIQNNPTLGYNYGPLFYAQSFHVMPFCRNYVQVNITGYLKVSHYRHFQHCLDTFWIYKCNNRQMKI